MIWISLLMAAATTQAPAPTPAPPASAPPTVSMKASHQALRGAMAAGDVAGIAAHSGAAGVPVGLRARGAWRVGDGAAAGGAAVDAELGAAGVAGDAWRVRCGVGHGRDAAAVVAAARRVAVAAPALLVADDEIAAAVVTAAKLGAAADSEQILGPLLQRPVPPFDVVGRARLATILRVVADSPGPLQRQAQARLVFELPEHQRAADLVALGDEADGAAGRVKRASTLERSHKNDEVLALLSKLAGSDCEAALLVGKTQRKMKRYAAARKAFAVAEQETCPEEIQKKASYLALRVAAVQRSAQIDALAKAFADRWGQDPLVDDVLLWLAEVQLARGASAAADATLARLIAEHPAGDMVDEARFRLAMRKAAANDADGAIALLKESAAHLASEPAWKTPDLDRARYWAARLEAAPSLTSLPSAKDAKNVDALLAFAQARLATFYGTLALRMAATLSNSLVGGLAPPSRVDDAAVVVPAALAKDVAWGHAVVAAAAGFDDDAAVLADEVQGGRGDVATATAIAALFSSLDRPDLAHQAFRDRGLAQLPGSVGDNPTAWSLAWPLAHHDVIAAAAPKAGVPPWLLQGLSREESAFDASVVSWAGAVGLCQLMPATAADEAKSLKLAPPTTADLVIPAYNARLGAAHLGRRLKGMRHPFMAIAAYNAGPGSVAKWMPKKGQSLPVDTWVEGITFDETRNYVKKVTGSWLLYAALAGEPSPTWGLSITGTR